MHWSRCSGLEVGTKRARLCVRMLTGIVTACNWLQVATSRTYVANPEPAAKPGQRGATWQGIR